MKKLDEMSNVISDKKFAWHENVIGDTPADERKCDFRGKLESFMVEEVCETFIMIWSTELLNRLFIVHVDIINIVY